MSIKLIAAIDQKRGIGKNGKLPWSLPSDIRYFRELIKDSEVIMGHGTFESMGHTPFKALKNIVVTSKDVTYNDVHVIHDLPGYLGSLDHDVWVVGGGKIYELALPFANELYITQIQATFDCDTFFPDFNNSFALTSESEPQIETGIRYTFQIWKPARN